MEIAYLEQHRREYELTKHVSLAMLDPVALIKLKETGQCFVELPEALFDLDYPAHYMRRIKSASLTIPCVTGPYTGVNCTLTLLSNSLRRGATTAEAYHRRGADDPRFADNVGAIRSIATSSAQNDTGVFELNFRDERYLPFEGAGAISRWRIELPRETNHFDLNTVSDVVIHLRYTAKEGGEPLKRDATEALADAASRTGVRLFSARHEFPGEWHRFLHPTETADPQSLQVELTPERFPFRFRGTQIWIDKVELFLKLKDGVRYPTVVGQQLRMFVRPPDAAATPLASLPNGTLVPEASLDGMPKASIDVPARGFGSWAIEAWSAHIGGIPLEMRVPDPVTVEGQPRHHLRPDVIEDLYVVCYYSGVD